MGVLGSIPTIFENCRQNLPNHFCRISCGTNDSKKSGLMIQTPLNFVSAHSTSREPLMERSGMYNSERMQNME